MAGGLASLRPVLMLEANAIIAALDLVCRINRQFRDAGDELLKLAALGVDGDDDSLPEPDMQKLAELPDTLWHTLKEELTSAIELADLPAPRKSHWQVALDAALRHAQTETAPT
ncbi:hypothetical protein NGM99_17125 [Mesorhizobium sp. RP14(2022)]|uniref:Uncharacterized protein n=1 Tax=Mesorhizobium liriopis TaxID=2953882 RepID=A0ABT1C9L3_9HYPH|nr:hypothetical protein [Mesorhizobium liriopis]MCO6051509.1 hypothetical protein [Mesorhizobium liriopis]